MKKLLNLAIAIAALIGASSAQATFSDPGLTALGGTFTQVDAYIRSPGITWASPGLNPTTPGWASAFTGSTLAVATGPAVPSVSWFSTWDTDGSIPFVTDYYVWNGNSLAVSARYVYDGSGPNGFTFSGPADQVSGPALVPVPEPSTILAGAMLLVPFGAHVTRSMRKRRTA